MIFHNIYIFIYTGEGNEIFHFFFSCQALVKRSVTLGGARGASGGNDETPPAPSIRRRPSSPTPPAIYAPPRRPVLAHNIQGKYVYL